MFLLVSLLLITNIASVLPASAAILPDSWTMMDGLSRVVSTNEDVGDVKNEKTVAMFYWPWHEQFAKENQPMNLSDLMYYFPEAKNDYYHIAWSTYASTYYFWEEPIYNYYSTGDTYVIRRQAELLADAGVDVIFMDLTNGTFMWETGVDIVFQVFQQAINDGVNAPKISFILNLANGADTRTQLTDLYNRIYSKNRYKDLWFYWDGKPLMMCSSSCLTSSQSAIKNFFTFRACEPSYNKGSTTVSSNKWGWLNIYPQAKYCVDDAGNVEFMTVGVAQNWNGEGLVAMNDPDGGVRGRSYSKGTYSYSYESNGKTTTVSSSSANSAYYGINFQQQWDYAIENDPEMIFVTGWNEWVAKRLELWQGTTNAFGDQFDVEHSRDIEPTTGVLKDYYYTQLVENIRRFKGASKETEYNTKKTININSSTDQWSDVYPAYTHYTNSYKKRDYRGYGAMYFKYETVKAVRNDIVGAKVAYDDEYVYFMAETADTLTSYTSDRWMRLFIDTDTDSDKSSWEGFEYAINRKKSGITSETTTLEKSTGGWNFTTVGKVNYIVSGNRIQIQVPRSYLGLGTGSNIPSFSFKWADNCIFETDYSDTEPAGNIMDVYKYGDSAPGSRFAFAFNAETVNEPVVTATPVPTPTPAPTPECVTPTPSPKPTPSPTPEPTPVPKLTLTGSNSKLSVSDGVLYGLSDEQTKETVSGYFENSENIVISKTIVGTGTTISLVIDGVTVDTLTVVVKGDVSGDGQIATNDYLLIKRGIGNDKLLTGVKFTAADINGDKSLSTTDYLRVKRHMGGKYNLYA